MFLYFTSCWHDNLCTRINALLSLFGIFWGVLGTDRGEGGSKVALFWPPLLPSTLAWGHIACWQAMSNKKLMIFMTQDWAFLLKWLSLVDYCTLVCLCLTSVVGLDAGTESSTTSAKLRSIFGDPDVRWIVKNRPTLQSWRAFSINTNILDNDD